MNINKENDILEITLSITEKKGYSEAYYFLRNTYQENSQNYGPQTLYFLTCLASEANMPEASLEWLRKAIHDNKWWYRPEVLEDDNLAALKNDKAFLSLKSISDNRYARAVSRSKAFFHGKRKQLTTCSWPFMEIHRIARSLEQIGNLLLEEAVSGRLKLYKVPSQTDMELIGGAMI